MGERNDLKDSLTFGYAVKAQVVCYKLHLNLASRRRWKAKNRKP